MAGKKDKPALYELIKKGHTTKPAWFRRKIAAKKRSLLKNPSAISDEQDAEPQKPGQLTNNKPSARPIGFAPIDQAQEGAASQSWFTEKKLLFTCSYLVLLLGGAILILVLLISFWLGQRSMIGHQADSTTQADLDNGPAKELKDLAQLPPRKNVFSLPPPTKNRVKAAERPKTVEKTENNIGPNMAGRRWIICGHIDKAVLGLVQKFFNDNGLSTLIRESDKEKRYVLVTAATFTNSTSEGAKKIKTLVMEIGQKYITHRPANAPDYKVSTFKGAYAVGADEIK